MTISFDWNGFENNNHETELRIMKETEIRPKEIFEEYLKLSAADAAAMAQNADQFVDVLCPGCGNPHAPEVYVKNGFQIRLCDECGSLFCSPRPSGRSAAGLLCT